MKKFSFRFEAVLKHRKRAEDDALQMLAKAQRAHQAERERKGALEQSLARAFADREKLGGETVGIAAFRITQDFIAGTKQRILQADHAIARAGKAVEKALRAYLNTRKQTRMIEVLREKAYADWKKERAKLEQRRIDDVVVMRARMESLAAGAAREDESTEESA